MQKEKVVKSSMPSKKLARLLTVLSYLFDFSRPVTVKTCKNVECKAVELVGGV